jgi:PAS domain S-box-containing protein
MLQNSSGFWLHSPAVESASDSRFDTNRAVEMLLYVAQARSLEDLFQRFVEDAAGNPRIACLQVWLIDKGDLCTTCPQRLVCPDQSRCLHLVAARGKSIPASGKRQHPSEDLDSRVPLGVGPIGETVVAGQGKGFVVSDEQPASLPGLEWLREEGIRGYRIVPIRFKGEPLGATVAFTRGDLQEEIGSWGRIFADHLGAAIANARAFEEVRSAGKCLEQANQRLVRELAERKEAEEKLRESEQRYRRIVDTASEGIWELDEHYATTLANRRMAEMLGYEPEEMEGKSVGEFLFEDDRASLLARIAGRRPELTERYEQRYRRKDGSTVWMYVSARTTLDAEHRLLGTFAMMTDITERKRAEEEVRYTAALWQATFDAVQDLVLLLDKDFRIVRANRAAAEFLGLPFDKIVGGHCFNLIHGTSIPPAECPLAKMRQSRRHEEVEVLARDGGPWLSVSVDPLFDPSGELTQVVHVARDITDRKRAEDALRRSEATLAEGQRLSHTGSWAWSPVTLQPLYWSEEMFRIYGLNPKEGVPTAETFWQRIHPEDRDRFRELQMEVAQRSLDYEHDHRVVLPDGTVKHIHAIGHPVRDEAGKLVEYVGTAMEVTERKRAEDALRRSEAYLAEGQRLAHMGSWAWSPATLQSLYWSEEMFRIYGLDPQEGVPTAETFWQRIHPEDLERTRDVLLKAAAGNMEYEHDHRIVLPDGTVKDIHAVGHPVLDQNEQVVEYVGTAMDVTERKLAEDELRKHREHLEDLVKQRTEQLAEAKTRAEAANRAKSTFLANMSHELRTPLNAVLGFSRLLKNDLDVTPQQQETLDIIVRSGEHLLNLINNVLDMAKIESGRVALKESEVDLNQLLHEMQSLMGAGAVEKGLRFSLEYDRDLPRGVAVDAGKLRQVLLNLLGNAIKYTDSGGVKLRARLASIHGSEKAKVRFEVEDSGAGISQEDCQRIFFSFVQLGDQAPAQSGTGLGLAICKQFVELMGGQIGVTSKPGTGSVFYFEIPVSILPSVAERDELKHRRILGLAEGQPAYRLLIVEDQPENRLLLRRLLNPLGFKLREAANGQEAVALFRQWHPDLIWMDIRMPVMDGLEAVRRIRATKAGADTKIIALTAHALEEEREPIMAAGCDDLVRKPIREQELFEALARHLRLKFIYETAPRQESAPETPEIPLNPEQLDALPAQLLQELRQAVIELDMMRTQALIEQVSERDASLGRALDMLATRLDYKRLLKLLEKEHPETGQMI